MYNISEARVKHFKNRHSGMAKTQVDFLQHLLFRKVGIFHHITGKDMTSLAPAAAKYCSTLQNNSMLINESAPA